jgi:eukaryotic-like serine/threonine-protein kinase
MSTPDRLTTALSDRYRIEREIGVGGMATVYLARDIRHDRDVAIKVLHPDLGAALGGERFLAEIRTTARLQHPHILPLLDSGAADGLLFYVMPHIAGETLRDRLSRETQLPVAEALRIAEEVADALTYAHGQGVIHRDIKPENILLNGGHALVADFGIALAVQTAGGARMTQTGLSLGTPQYMAPEQAMGEKLVDARADVYALGAVTYEMLAGAPPFVGATVQAIVARILTEKPGSLRTLREHVPVHVDEAVLAALEKLPADRIASAAEFSRALTTPGLLNRTAAHESPANGPRRRRYSHALTALAAAVAGVLGTYLLLDTGGRAPAPAHATFVAASLGISGVQLAILAIRIAIAPDGRHIAYVAADSGGAPHVFLRAMNELAVRDLGSGRAPTFSPDGRSLAYTAEGVGTMVVPVSGGVPSRLHREMAVSSWGEDGRIRYVRGMTDGQFFSLEVTTGARDSVRFGADTLVTHVELLPAGRLLLSLEVGGIPRIVVRDPDGGTRFLLDGESARHGTTGYLLMTRREGEHFVLMRVPFDAGTGVVTGRPETLATETSARSYAVAKHTGDVVYLSGSMTTDRQIITVDRVGAETTISHGTRPWLTVRSAADGEALVATTWDGRNRSVWTVNGATGAISRLTRDVDAFRPVLSVAAARVYYNIPGKAWIWELAATGGTAVALNAPAGAYISSLSPDGSTLWLRVENDIWKLVLRDTAAVAALVLATPAVERDALASPDGQWLAYTTDASGSRQVVVAPMAAPANATQVSSDGVEPLRWSADSRRLFYHDRDEIREVGVGPSGVTPGTSRRIFSVPASFLSVDVAPDGQRLFAVRGGMLYSDLVVRQGALR